MIELDIQCSPATGTLDMARVDRLCQALDNKPQLMAKVRKHLGIKAPQPVRVTRPTFGVRSRDVRTAERMLTLGTAKQTAQRQEPLIDEICREKKGDLSTMNSFFRKYCDSANDCGKRKADQKKSALTLGKEKPRAELIAGASKAEWPLTIREPDPDYFDMIKGRPVTEKFNRQTFSSTQRTVIFKKLYAGFLRDDVRRRQEHHRLDLWELDRIDEELGNVKKTLEVYTNEGHAESVKIVKEQMEVSKVRELKEIELRRSKGRVNVIKSALYKKDGILSSSIHSRDILMQLSPPEYRLQYNQAVIKHRKTTKFLVDKVIRLFSDYCRYNPDPEPDLFLDEVVATFVKQLLSLGPPTIYFKRGWEIDSVFRKMELQCVEQMADLAEIEQAYDEIERIGKGVKVYYAAHIADMNQEIETSKMNTKYEDGRADELEAEANLALGTSFKEIVSGDIVLETTALVEILYDYIFGPSNAKFELPEMMSQIEDELRNVATYIQDIGDLKYQMYKKKVERRMKAEEKEAKLASSKNREVRAAILQVKRTCGTVLGGWRWRKLVPRSHLRISKKKLEKKTTKEDKRFCHLLLDRVCERDDVEAEVSELLVKLVDPTKGESPEDAAVQPAASENSSLRSSVGSLSIENEMRRGVEPEEVESADSLSIIQLDYDSNDELLRKNFEKRKAYGHDISEPEVLYDVKSIDSLFNVSDKNKTMVKNKKHFHRPEKKVRTNPLNWR